VLALSHAPRAALCANPSGTVPWDCGVRRRTRSRPPTPHEVTADIGEPARTRPTPARGPWRDRAGKQVSTRLSVHLQQLWNAAATRTDFTRRCRSACALPRHGVATLGHVDTAGARVATRSKSIGATGCRLPKASGWTAPRTAVGHRWHDRHGHGRIPAARLQARHCGLRVAAEPPRRHPRQEAVAASPQAALRQRVWAPGA